MDNLKQERDRLDYRDMMRFAWLPPFGTSGLPEMVLMLILLLFCAKIASCLYG